MSVIKDRTGSTVGFQFDMENEEIEIVLMFDGLITDSVAVRFKDFEEVYLDYKERKNMEIH